MTRRRGPGFAGVRGYTAAESITDVARTASRSRAKPKDANRNVDVLCWCERKVVRVPLSVVNEGRTESCGLARCHAPDE